MSRQINNKGKQVMIIQVDLGLIGQDAVKSMQERTNWDWYLSDTRIPLASYLSIRERMVRITSPPQGQQGYTNIWLRQQYKVGAFDQTKLSE